MGATKVGGVPVAQEVNFNDLFVTDIGSDGAINATAGGVDVVTPMPEIKVMDTTGAWDSTKNFVNTGAKTSGDSKESGGFGSTLQGIGAVTGALASVYGIQQQKKYQDKVLKMEEDRVEKNEARRDEKQAAYEKVWGA